MSERDKKVKGNYGRDAPKDIGKRSSFENFAEMSGFGEERRNGFGSGGGTHSAFDAPAGTSENRRIVSRWRASGEASVDDGIEKKQSGFSDGPGTAFPKKEEAAGEASETKAALKNKARKGELFRKNQGRTGNRTVGNYQDWSSSGNKDSVQDRSAFENRSSFQDSTSIGNKDDLQNRVSERSRVGRRNETDGESKTDFHYRTSASDGNESNAGFSQKDHGFSSGRGNEGGDLFSEEKTGQQRRNARFRSRANTTAESVRDADSSETFGSLKRADSLKKNASFTKQDSLKETSAVKDALKKTNAVKNTGSAGNSGFAKNAGPSKNAGALKKNGEDALRDGFYSAKKVGSEASGDSKEDLSERTFFTGARAGKRTAFAAGRGAGELAGKHFSNTKTRGAFADGDAASAFFNEAGNRVTFGGQAAFQSAAAAYGTAGAQGTAGAKSSMASVFQKRQIRKAYARGESSLIRNSLITRIKEKREAERTIGETKTAFMKIADFVRKRPVIIFVLIVSVLFGGLFSVMTSVGGSLIGQVTGQATSAASFSAEDEDIKGAEEDYEALEADLRERLDNLEESYPGYSNYNLTDAEIGHDPYRLAALLTVLHESYTREEVQDDLQRIFDLQYNIKTEDETGTSSTKTVGVGESLGTVVTSGYCNCVICCGKWAGGTTASGVYPTANHTLAVDSENPIVPMGTKVIMNGIEYTVEDTGPLNRYGVAFDVYYDDHQTALRHGHKNWEAYIADDNSETTVTVSIYNSLLTLGVALENNGISYAASELLDDDQMERYNLLVLLKGCREDLFPDDIYANASAGENYIPTGEAMSDEQFANIYNEAVKYLGVPYEWGGYSPEGFDCSGFVSYVINHCGNGWNFGRLTANGWWKKTAHISASEAKPGDLVFFQGTYGTYGASHIGIYLGEGMMIHAGNPVKITNINSQYYQKHFLGFGRIS